MWEIELKSYSTCACLDILDLTGTRGTATWYQYQYQLYYSTSTSTTSLQVVLRISTLVRGSTVPVPVTSSREGVHFYIWFFYVAHLLRTVPYSMATLRRAGSRAKPHSPNQTRKSRIYSGSQFSGFRTKSGLDLLPSWLYTGQNFGAKSPEF